MPLDPQVQFLLEQLASLNAPEMDTQTPEAVREGMKMQIAMFGAPQPIAHIENRTIPVADGEIPIRIYRPEVNGLLPVLVYFHGGGWVIGDLDTHEEVCRSLAKKVKCAVVSVDYRLAPEYKFPVAPEDCYAATQWVTANAAQFQGDTSRIAIGGDSAGGNLAAVVAQMARDRSGPKLVFQLLIYPATDFRMNTPSIDENAEGYFLTKKDMIWFTNHYLNNEEEKLNPLASPFLAADLHGLPPALVITAEYDPLRDEGERYGQRLQEAGVPTTVSRYDGMIHGFFSMEAILTKSQEAVAESVRALQTAFNTK